MFIFFLRGELMVIYVLVFVSIYISLYYELELFLGLSEFDYNTCLKCFS